MPSSRPVATDLLSVVEDYLDREVSPLLPPLQQFQLKIVRRLLQTLRRELQLGPDADALETARLSSLLSLDAPLAELNAELARAIHNGEFSTSDPALLSHLRETIEDALRINNPKWLPKTDADAGH